MNLQEYLNQFKLSGRRFAQFAGVTPNIIYRVMHGEKITRRSSKKIKRCSKGVVDYQNIRGLYDE